MNEGGMEHVGGDGLTPIGMRRLIYLVARGKWWILGGVLVGAMASAAWTTQQPEVYEAECVIEYDPQPPRPLGSGVEDARGESEYWLTREFFETQNEVITSRRISEIVVENLGLQHDADFMNVPASERDAWEGVDVSEAAIVVQGMLTVASDDETRLVRVLVRDFDAERAALLANGVADAYVTRTVESRATSTVNALEWLAGQLDELGEQLSESELALHEFKQEHNVLSVSLEDRQNLVANEVRLFHDELTAARAERVTLGAAHRQLREAGQGDPMEMPARIFEDSPSVVRLRQSIDERRAERATLTAEYGESHPRIIALDRQVGELLTQLSREIASFVAAAEMRLRAAEQRISRLESLLDAANQRGLNLNLEGIDYERLHRDRESNERLYNLVLQRTSETNLTSALRTTHASVLDRALVPMSRVSPVMSRNVVLGAAFGMVSSLLLLVVLSSLRRIVTSVEDAEEVGLPILGIFPKAETVPRARRQGVRMTSRGSPLAPVENADLVAHKRPMSIAAECCKTIRTNLMFRAGAEAVTMFVVTSPNSEEGKTTVAANVAATIAQSGKRVVLIDADLRRPRIHKLFEIEPKPGLSSLLTDEADLDDVIVSSMVARLDIIPAGTLVQNPSELLHAEALPRIISEIKQRYDVVIFDSPPIGPVTDAAILASEVGKVMLLAKAESTTRDALSAALKQLTDVGAEVVGGVLNSVDLTGGPYRYYHYRRYGRAGYYAYGGPSIDVNDDDAESRDAAG